MNILLPVDFSERSAGAAYWARMLARKFGSEITLVHVLAPPQAEFGAADIAGSMLAELCGDHSQQAARELATFAATHLPGFAIHLQVLHGAPATSIVDFAHSEHTSLIMMPTHGYGPFRRFILGSNTAKVLHDAECPVWTGAHIESPPESPAGVQRILCAVDLGPQSAKAICWAATLARAYEASLTLLHVTACDPQLRSAAGDELSRLRSEAGIDAEIALETGEPSRLICAAASQGKADVLVIGRGSAAGVFGRLRTNAHAIIRSSPCPVVSV